LLQKRLVGTLLYYLWGFERIIWWEMDSDKENTPSIGTVIWTNDGGLPMEHIFSNRTCNAHFKKRKKKKAVGIHLNKRK
jgi:hypothetical protein